jgi:hypothetical protein
VPGIVSLAAITSGKLVQVLGSTTKNSPILFFLLVSPARSGRGDVINKTLELKCGAIIGFQMFPESFTPEALLEFLPVTPNCIVANDEATFTLGSKDYLTGLSEVLCQVYYGYLPRSIRVKSKKIAGGGSVFVPIVLGIQDKRLDKIVSSETLAGGFLSRFILLEGGREIQENFDPPPEVVIKIALKMLFVLAVLKRLKYYFDMYPSQIVVDFPADVRNLITKIANEKLAEYYRHELEDFFIRVEENLSRLTLVFYMNRKLTELISPMYKEYCKIVDDFIESLNARGVITKQTQIDIIEGLTKDFIELNISLFLGNALPGLPPNPSNLQKQYPKLMKIINGIRAMIGEKNTFTKVTGETMVPDVFNEDFPSKSLIEEKESLIYSTGKEPPSNVSLNEEKAAFIYPTGKESLLLNKKNIYSNIDSYKKEEQERMNRDGMDKDLKASSITSIGSQPVVNDIFGIHSNDFFNSTYVHSQEQYLRQTHNLKLFTDDPMVTIEDAKDAVKFLQDNSFSVSGSLTAALGGKIVQDAQRVIEWLYNDWDKLIKDPTIIVYYNDTYFIRSRAITQRIGGKAGGDLKDAMDYLIRKEVIARVPQNLNPKGRASTGYAINKEAVDEIIKGARKV